MPHRCGVNWALVIHKEVKLLQSTRKNNKQKHTLSEMTSNALNLLCTIDRTESHGCHKPIHIQ